MKRQYARRANELKDQFTSTSVDNLWKSFFRKDLPEVRILLKADTYGTLQVVQNELKKLPDDKVILKIVKASVGDVIPSDLFLAETTKARILGFGISKKRGLNKSAVSISIHSTLQEVVAVARTLMEDALPPLSVEKQIGRVSVRKIIKSSKLGKIAGCFVTEGVVRRNSRLRLVRDDIVLWQGGLASLKRFKDEAKEVRENFECGIRLAGGPTVQEDDILEVLEIKKIKQRLSG